MNNNIKNVINFYMLANSLKDKIRSGWKLWNVSKERLESVAEHIYGTCILAIAIDSEFKVNVDLNKVLKMLVLHELEEVIIGDLTPYDNVSDNEKIEQGKNAVKILLKDLVKKEEYELLLDEFNLHVTKESLFAFYCDKLEADLQAKIYDEQGFTNIHDSRNKVLIEKEWNKLQLENGAKNLSDLFIGYDIINYNELFKEICKYIKDNNIYEGGQLNE